MHHFKIRQDSITPVHTTFTIFANGANCGRLTMRNEEADAFYNALHKSAYLGTHAITITPTEAAIRVS